MIDSDRRPVSNRRPLLKSVSTDVIISYHGPILGYSQITVLSKLSNL
jgi:tetrahydromethanopterin S-methyltransferase subunit E